MEWLLLVLALACPPAAGETLSDAQKRQRIVKAGMINGFLSYIQWPVKQDPFVIGVVGKDPFFVEALEEYLKRRRGTQPQRYQIKRIEAKDIDCCQLLILLQGSGIEAQTLMSHLKNKPVLTVSDQEGFAAAGGHINFFHRNNRLRFTINWSSTVNAGFKIGSRLLNLAVVINRPNN